MSEELPVVNEEVTEPIEQEPVEIEEPTVTAPPAGSKTDETLLLKSLHEEREKRRLLEEQLNKLKSSNLPDEAFSDEGRLLQSQIQALQSKIATFESETVKNEILGANPVLKDKWAEFEQFTQSPENQGMSLKTAAKAFLVENGLLNQPRKGLEKPTGGTRTPLVTGMTAEDVKTLRTTNFKKYTEMLEKGLIKIG